MTVRRYVCHFLLINRGAPGSIDSMMVLISGVVRFGTLRSSRFYGLSWAHAECAPSIPLRVIQIRSHRCKFALRRRRSFNSDGPVLALPDVRRGRSPNLRHVGSLSAYGDPCLDFGQIPDHTSRCKVEAARKFATAFHVIDRRVCQRHDLTQFGAADCPSKRQRIRRHQLWQVRSILQRLFPHLRGLISCGGRPPWAMCFIPAIRIACRGPSDFASQDICCTDTCRLSSYHKLPPTLRAPSVVALASSPHLARHAPRATTDRQTRSLAAAVR